MGAGAQLANSEELAIIQQGAKAWNEWRGKNKERASCNLSGADLRHMDLTTADFRGIDLTNANLEGVKLGPGTLLRDANLAEADLNQANLRGAEFQNVNFSNANLFKADLRETNLQGADLSTAKGGLLSRQLAGSDLTGAKLPEPLAKLYAEMSSAKEISSNAQKLFLALLAGCLYSWLTIAQTTDVELITNRATTPLPVIQAAIPIVGFYVVAPLILLCLYFYFHFYLQKLWEELGSLPAVFTDGRELHKRTDPWLLNDLVRSHFTKLKDGRPFLSYFQAWVSVVLAWWAVPITLYWFWGRFLKRHDLLWTSFHALLFVVSAFSAVELYRIAHSTLQGQVRAGFNLRTALTQWHKYRSVLFLVGCACMMIWISHQAIFGVPIEDPLWTDVRGLPVNYSPNTWISRIRDWVSDSPFANLTNADVSIKPQDWTGKKTEELDLVKGATLISANLRYAKAPNAFLAKAHLENSDLYGALLIFADMRRSSLQGTRLDKAVMIKSQLNAADLTAASLVDVNLMGADMSEANLQSAKLSNASLLGVTLIDANLQSAILTNASVMGADLTRANLHSAVLQGANFTGANLTRVAVGRTNLTDVLFNMTIVKYADFRFAMGLQKQLLLAGCRDWQLAFYDTGMLKQLGLPPDHNEKLQKQMEAELKQTKSAATIPATSK
jgi:uncharacterized protein YjbI with pentapeptide repeats